MLGRLRGFFHLERDQAEPTGALARLRFWAAIGMVAASVLSALAVLKTSVYDETASHEDAVYRQQLMTREGAAREREELVAQDLAVFGSYEQHAARASDLRAAARVAAPAAATALRSRAERELAIGAALYERFRVGVPGFDQSGHLEYDLSIAYGLVNNGVAALDTGLGPAPRRLDARSARHDGVRMAGVAALFLIAVVLFTVAQVYAAFRSVKRESPEAGPAAALPAVDPAVLRVACLIFGAAIGVSIAGVYLGLGMVT